MQTCMQETVFIMFCSQNMFLFKHYTDIFNYASLVKHAHIKICIHRLHCTLLLIGSLNACNILTYLPPNEVNLGFIKATSSHSTLFSSANRETRGQLHQIIWTLDTIYISEPGGTWLEKCASET